MMTASNSADTEVGRSGINLQSCTLNAFGQYDAPTKTFNQDTNSRLPKGEAINGVFAVDTVANLSRYIGKNRELTIVSVPSLEIMETVTGFPSGENMKQNFTGIVVPRDVVASWNDEVLKRNISLQNSKNLKDYTFRMLSALAVAIGTNPKYANYIEAYSKGAITLYTRDLVMCTFDAKP